METDNWCKYMANQNITDNDPYSKEQLGMHFDPFIYKHIKELKALLKKRMKKQGLIFHELEYLLRDYYSEATRVIKKNNGILDKFIGDGIFAYFGYQDKNLI